jgi:hypothetical protein
MYVAIVEPIGILPALVKPRVKVVPVTELVVVLRAADPLDKTAARLNAEAAK